MNPLSIRILRTVLVCLVLAVSNVAVGQIRPLADMPMTANGVFGVGYAGGSGGGNSGGAGTVGSNSTNAVYLLTSGGVSGYYYNPKFLRFNFTPNWRWESNATASDTLRDSNEGVGASIGFLEGSSHPVYLQYNLDRLTTSTLSSGAAPVSARSTGLNQNLSVGTSFHPKYLPMISLFANKGLGSNTTLGSADAKSTTDAFSYGASAGYRILNFQVSASYNDTDSHTHTPDLLNLGIPSASENRQKIETITVSRKLPLNSDVNATYSHTATNLTLQGTESKLTYDNATGYWNALPTRRLSLSASASYLSNAGAELISQLASGQATNTTGQVAAGRETSFGGSAGYTIGKGLGAYFSVGHSNSTSGGSEAKFDTVGAGVSFARMIHGGKFQGIYTPQYYRVEQDTPTTTVVSGTTISKTVALVSSGMAQSGSANYARRLGRWVGSGNFSMTISDGWSDTSNAVLSTSTSGGARLSTRISHEWNYSGGFNMTDTSLAGMTGNLSGSLYSSIANKTWSFTVQDQLGHGYMVASPLGLTSTGGTSTSSVFKTYYSTSNGVSGTVSYSRRRLQLITSLSKAISNIETQTSPVNNGNLNLDSHMTYKFRKVNFQAGYQRWTQNSTGNGSLNQHLQTYWFQVMREFHAF